jgi:hypothetical protein
MKLRSRSVIAFLLGAAMATAAHTIVTAGAPADVSGTWAMTVKGSGAHGDMSASLALKQEGKKVTGTMAAHGYEHHVSGEFVDGTLSLDVTREDQQMTLTAKLKEDGTLAGYVSGPMGDLAWTAQRVEKQ